MRHLDDISDGLPPDYIKRLEDIEQEIDAKIALEEVKSGVRRFDDSVPNTSGKKKKVPQCEFLHAHMHETCMY